MSARGPVIPRPIRPPPSPARTLGAGGRSRNTLARRVITFVVLVSAGVGSLMFFGDDPQTPRGSRRVDVPAIPGLVAGRSETTVLFGITDFDITGVFEVAPGRFERRVEYVVHFEEGRPDEDGFLLLAEPRILVKNPLTGDDRGEIAALTGRCRTDQATAGGVNLSTSDMTVESISLAGDVRGRYTLDDGSEITLRAEEIEQAGDRLHAPGQALWTRDALSLSGRDMRWERARGHLEFGADTVISLGLPGSPAAAILRGAGGLVWDQPPGSGNLGRGSLRGPVSGELGDGSTLSAALLTLDGDVHSLTLVGQALLEQPLPDGRRRARAEQITVALDEEGGLALGRADGSVRLEQQQPGSAPSWLEASSLTEEDGRIFAEGQVRWGQGPLGFSGRELTYDQRSGRLTCAADVLMEVPADASSPLAGMTFRSPGGMEWLLLSGDDDPWSEALGHFTGEVTGRTADGLHFRCDTLQRSGPAGRLLLNGAVQAEQRDGTSLHRLQARIVDLALGQGKRPVDLIARGEVALQFFASERDEQPTRSLTAEMLRLVGDVVLAPGEVLLEQSGFTARGSELDYDFARGHLELSRDVVVSLDDGTVVHSPSGLVWRRPANRSLGFDQGQGLLRGPARGESPGGLTFVSRRVELDGGQRRLSLVGEARVSLPGGRELTAQRLSLVLRSSGRRIESDTPIHWSGPLARGEAVGLHYDTVTRELRFERDVTIDFLDLRGQPQVQLASTGPLTWNGPQDPALPLWFGSGQLQDTVTAVLAGGRRLITNLLLLEGDTGRFDLIGPSHVALPEVQGLGDLAAQERITLLQDLSGEIVWLDAYGAVDSVVETSGGTLKLGAEALLYDRDAGALLLDGESHIDRTRDGRTVGLAGDATTRLVLAFDENGELFSMAGEGRITSDLGSLTILSDSLNWDVPEDYMLLSGHCRVRRLGRESATSKVEIWPVAWRWHVHPLTSDVDGG